jgi:Anti-sigma factor NepR
MTKDTTGENSGSDPDNTTVAAAPPQPVKDERSQMGKNMSGGESGSKPVDARVARRRQDPIGRRLRQMYDDVVSEEIPDDFLGFLEQADDRRAAGADEMQAGGRAKKPVPESET